MGLRLEHEAIAEVGEEAWSRLGGVVVEGLVDERMDDERMDDERLDDEGLDGVMFSAYLIFVIFFTRTKFLENKIYTEKCQFFALNL